MSVQLRKLSDQVIVITGASSGIGLVTARQAARQGARVVLAARSEEALHELTNEITASGGQATYVVADVGVLDDVRRIADAAIARYGGFDTWVNNAGHSIYGRLAEVPLSEQRQVFETNYWGLVHGCLVAAEHLRKHGGTIINVGSVVSDRAIPLQGTYCASKHAVKGFTDAFRMELEHEGAPIVVTLIKPGTIDTPYVDHAKNYLSTRPANVGPAYAPEVVADAILHCAEHPRRDVVVGGGGRMITLLGQWMPRLVDRFMERIMFSGQHSDQPPGPREEHSLYDGSGQLQERGGHPGHVSESSAYTKTALHPLATGAIVLGAVGLAAASYLLVPGTRHTTRRSAARAISKGLNRLSLR